MMVLLSGEMLAHWGLCLGFFKIRQFSQHASEQVIFEIIDLLFLGRDGTFCGAGLFTGIFPGRRVFFSNSWVLFSLRTGWYLIPHEAHAVQAKVQGIEGLFTIRLISPPAVRCRIIFFSPFAGSTIYHFFPSVVSNILPEAIGLLQPVRTTQRKRPSSPVSSGEAGERRVIAG